MLPALLLTAGLGTRLRPLSFVRAKPAMPLAGTPLVRRILGWLGDHGVTDVVLNLHHRPETVTQAVGDGSDLGLRVRYSWENPILGSAGGPRRALPLLGSSRFLLVNGDTLTDLDLPRLIERHNQSGARSSFTGLGSDKTSWHFIWIQVAEAKAFSGLPPDQPAESVASLYPSLIRDHPGSVSEVEW